MWVKGGDAVWGNATFAPDDEEVDHHTHGELISFRLTAPIPRDDKDAETPPFMQGEAQTAATQVAWRNLAPVSKNLTADEAGEWILKHTPLTFRVGIIFSSAPLILTTSQKMIATNYSYGIEREEDVLRLNDLDHTKWTNPLEIRYPCCSGT
jgi:phospholipid:diacylglycerol acyltransferase